MSTPKLIPSVKYPIYLTVIEDRRPQQKLHQNIGRAKNAVGYDVGWVNGGYTVRGGQIYVMKDADSDWELLYDITPRSLASHLPWRQ